MSGGFPNSFYNNNYSKGINDVPSPSLDAAMPFARSCPELMPIGWNAMLVGLLSSLLVIAFLLTCLYYLAFRRRYVKELSGIPSPLPLVDKVAASGIPVTSTSQGMSTTILNEPGKETKITTYTEQGSGPIGVGDFAINMPAMGNGHAAPALTNGLLANGNTDPSELRLLQHEHH